MNYNDTSKTINYSGLLNDLQKLIDSLNATINFIKTGPKKMEVEFWIGCDGDELDHIRECLHNGGYNND